MIKEVAVEPEVMATYSHFRELWEDCGVSRGRLLSEYPSDWRDVVCRMACEISSTKAASIAARLKPLPGHCEPRKWIRTNRAYDKGKDWLTNAERHEPLRAFDAIVARRNPHDKSRVLIAGEFAKDRSPWKVHTQIEVPRTADGLLGCVSLLLESSSELVLIDRNFDAAESRFRNPLLALIKAKEKSSGSWRRCELHLGHPLTQQGVPDKAVLANRIHHLRHFLASSIPVGNTLRVRFWCRKPGGKRLHPRFILTELGGVQYDYGLDEGDSPRDTTIVCLMDDDLWQVVRGDYGLDPARAPAFATAPDCLCEIEGR